ncbi:hypothetical protein J1605_015562 [Eschrichtius robustus]|uniref:Uncharacterized protein n=1 Tax=Eschrichtius robustus TaxID=9764 RepID=A0AB34G934_ESCRO|nr:hypothetical protein J1605_015562 [Eschrichtius robustus]
MSARTPLPTVNERDTENVSSRSLPGSGGARRSPDPRFTFRMGRPGSPERPPAAGCPPGARRDPRPGLSPHPPFQPHFTAFP